MCVCEAGEVKVGLQKQLMETRCHLNELILHVDVDWADLPDARLNLKAMWVTSSSNWVREQHQTSADLPGCTVSMTTPSPGRLA